MENIIKFIIISLGLIFAFYLIGNTTVVRAEDNTSIYQLGEKIPESVIDSYIKKYATGTKAYQMKRTIYCESGYKNIQSNIINKEGNKEDSWGIAQINLYWNPQVSKKQALDPLFAIKFMSDNWNKVKWYGYVSKTDTCNIIYK